MSMRLWSSLTLMQKFDWEDENRPYKMHSNRRIRMLSGITNRIPNARNIRGFAKRHKRQGRYLFAKQLQRESQRLQRRLGKAEVERQLLEMYIAHSEGNIESDLTMDQAFEDSLFKRGWMDYQIHQELDTIKIVDMGEGWDSWDWRPPQPEPVFEATTRWYYTHEGD